MNGRSQADSGPTVTALNHLGRFSSHLAFEEAQPQCPPHHWVQMWDLRFFLLGSPEHVNISWKEKQPLLSKEPAETIFETKLGDISLDQKPAITSLVIIIPSVDAIMEILA